MLTNLFAILLVTAAVYVPCPVSAEVARFDDDHSGNAVPPSGIGSEFYRGEPGEDLLKSRVIEASRCLDATVDHTFAAPSLDWPGRTSTIIAQSIDKSEDRVGNQARGTSVEVNSPVAEENSDRREVSAREDVLDAGKRTSKGVPKDKNRSGKASKELESVRVYTARLKGSMCAACLIQLEEKFQKMHGVLKARIVRPQSSTEERFAEIEILYVQPKLNQQKIRKLIERNDFGLSKERDSAAAG